VTSRERVRRTLQFEGPDRAPRDLWALPGVGMFRQAELDEVAARFPGDFAGPWVKYGTSERARGKEGVVGDYIDTYDILRSVEDRATVPIFYESRLAKIELLEEERPRIDPDFEEITEDEEKLTFTMNPCGSGQRLVRLGRYGEGGYGTTAEAHSWSYGREGFPLYCTHCAFMNEALPIRWIGYPVYPSDPPQDFHADPCTWYWYKDPADIPERHYARHGERAQGGGGGD